MNTAAPGMTHERIERGTMFERKRARELFIRSALAAAAEELS
jgi:hypothetical protein